MNNEEYYNDLKNEYLNHKAYKETKRLRDNIKDLSHYYNIGKILYEAQGGEKRAKYGDGLIKEYSKRMSEELGEGYSVRTLLKCRQYYLVCQISPSMPAKLTSYKKDASLSHLFTF